MLSRAWGLTKTYNRVHDPDVHEPAIQELRDIHVAIDEAVMRAYGWDDLDLKIGHHPTKIGIRWTVSKEARFELLDRLLEENHRRYAAGEPVVTTPDVTSFQVRAELEDLLERDLLGPWDGPEEELPPGTSPAERYMLGRLVPRQQPEEPADDEQLEPELVDREVASPASGDDGEEEDAEADATVRSGSMAASAIGLAFSVPATRRCDQRGRQVGPVRAVSVGDARDADRAGRDHLAPGAGGRVRSRCGPTPRGRTRSCRTTSSRAWSSGTRCGTAGRGGSSSWRSSTGSGRRRRPRTRRGCTRWG